jgi:hypothetical protein
VQADDVLAALSTAVWLASTYLIIISLYLLEKQKTNKNKGYVHNNELN